MKRLTIKAFLRPFYTEHDHEGERERNHERGIRIGLRKKEFVWIRSYQRRRQTWLEIGLCGKTHDCL